MLLIWDVGAESCRSFSARGTRPRLCLVVAVAPGVHYGWPATGLFACAFLIPT